MTRQKSFKREVRARMSRTGERYTAARSRLVARPDQPTGGARPTQPATVPAPEMPTSDAALRTATGRGWDEWLGILDAFGAIERRHADIVRWLMAEQGVGGWWAQSITGGYERARGLRAKHQMPSGFAVGVNRTLAAPAHTVGRAITEAAIRARWLGEVELRPRPTRAAGTARFDWPDGHSRVVVYFVDKGDRTQVSVSHERLADAEQGERMKAFWRHRLAQLKTLVEAEVE